MSFVYYFEVSSWVEGDDELYRVRARALTKEDVEKIVDEKLRRLLENSQLKKKMNELESSIIDLRNRISSRARVKPADEPLYS